MLIFFWAKINAQPNLNKEIELSANSYIISDFISELSTKGNIEFSYGNNIEAGKKIIIPYRKNTLRGMLGYLHQYDIKIAIYQNKYLLLPVKKELARSEFIKIRGQVLEKKSLVTIPAANIFIKNTQFGTISNPEGYFELNVPHYLQGQVLTFSFLGYHQESIIVPVKDTVVSIELKLSRAAIDEVVVEHHNALRLMQKAASRYYKNYSNEPVELTAFFRERISYKEKYISVSEALVQIYKESYDAWQNDKIKLLAGRTAQAELKNNPIKFIVQGGLYYNLNLDVVKQKANFIDPEYFDYYNFSFLGLTMLDSIWCYIVRFKQILPLDGPTYDGIIFIERDNYAIAGVEFHINDKHKEAATNFLVEKMPANYKAKVLGVKYFIQYKPFGEEWFIHKITGSVDFELKKVFDTTKYQFSTISDYLIVNNKTEDIKPIYKKETVHKQDVVVNQLSDESPYLWSTSKIDPSLSIEELAAGFLYNNQYILANSFTKDDYDIIKFSPSIHDKDTIYKSKVVVKHKTFIPLSTSEDLIVGVQHPKNLSKNKILSNDPDIVMSFIDSVLQIENNTVYQNRLKALKIITHVLDSIPTNYPSKPTVLTAFYKESVKQDANYIKSSEVLVNILKQKYTHYKSDKINIVSGRSLKEQGVAKNYDFKIQGGLTNTLKLDIVKYKPSFIDPNYFEFYNYHYSGIKTLDDSSKVYLIEFDQKDYIKYPLFKGRLYVDVESMAIRNAEFKYSPKGIIYANGSLVMNTPSGTKVNPTETWYTVSYINLNSKWVLDNACYEVAFMVEPRKNKVNTTTDYKEHKFSIYSEYVVTHTDQTVNDSFQSAHTLFGSEKDMQQIRLNKELWVFNNMVNPSEDAHLTWSLMLEKSNVFNNENVILKINSN